MELSLGISLGFSRFISQKNLSSTIGKIKKFNLNSLELGLLNCSIGRTNIPGMVPFPTDTQVQVVRELFPSSQNYLSVHGPYRISVTSEEKNVLKFSKANLSATLKVTDMVDGHHVTFHGGSFKKKHNNEHVKHVLQNWEEWREEKGFKAKLAPEVGGKYNSFADFFTLVEIASEIDQLLFTWDISHDFARGGNITSESGILQRLEVIDSAGFQLNPMNRLPMHFSGMVVGKAGEKYHTLLGKGNGVPWELVFSVLKEQNYLSKVNIICESKIPKGEKMKGNSISDAVKAKEFLLSDKIVKKYISKPGHLDHYF
ncbi:MAG: TIM barrel protein [Candidatus Hodarchaeales archaeon]|jgi:endonuclease IV